MTEFPVQVLILSHLAACLMMTGLIWLVQLVHYPAFHFADKSRFCEFHSFHSKWVTVIVAPLMGLELVTALALCLQGGSIWIANLISVAALWGATALISVPLHNQLSSGYDSSTVQRLVRTNWIRTVLWTLRSAGLLIAFSRM